MTSHSHNNRCCNDSAAVDQCTESNVKPVVITALPIF